MKTPVGVVFDPGGIASLPQQSGEWGSGTLGKTLAAMKPKALTIRPWMLLDAKSQKTLGVIKNTN